LQACSARAPEQRAAERLERESCKQQAAARRLAGHLGKQLKQSAKEAIRQAIKQSKSRQQAAI
jgi:ribosomal 50S subunit-associated protein YjgA (DUF615 family)